MQRPTIVQQGHWDLVWHLLSEYRLDLVKGKINDTGLLPVDNNSACFNSTIQLFPFRANYLLPPPRDQSNATRSLIAEFRGAAETMKSIEFSSKPGSAPIKHGLPERAISLSGPTVRE